MAIKQADFTRIFFVWNYIGKDLKICINSYIWENERGRYIEKERDSKTVRQTDNIIYQNPNRGGVKGD